MAGQEYDRQRAAALAKHVLKLQSADAGHPHVEQDTAFCGGIVRIEERLSRGEGDSTDASHRYVTRFVHDEALQAVAARTTAAHMRLWRETVERPFSELKWRIFGYPRFLMRGRGGAGTELAIGVLGYNLKQALRALSPIGLIAALAT